MNNLLQYVFEVILGSSVLFLGFYLSRNFLGIVFRRYFLLSCLGLPLVLPLISLDTSEKIASPIQSQVNQIFTIPIEENQSRVPFPGTASEEITQSAQDENTTISRTSVPWINIAVIISLIVSAFLFIRLCISIFSILKLVKTPITEHNGKRFHLIENQQFSGGSFFNFIFINRKFLDDPVLEIILSHEHVHSRFLHSMDILLSEIYCILFWFNPVSWLLRKEIRVNTELHADLIAAQGYDKYHYSDTLLNLSIQSQNIGPVISFSAIHIGQRIKHILSEQRHHWSKSLLTIPFLVVATWLISCEPEMMDFNTLNNDIALKNIKSIKSKYFRHKAEEGFDQESTVAVALFDMTGELIKTESFSQYPFTSFSSSENLERTLNYEPSKQGLLAMMDGISMGRSAYHFLYGAMWPKYLESSSFGPMKLSNECYQEFSTGNEYLPARVINKTTVSDDYYSGGKLRIKKGTQLSKVIDEFIYDEGKVISNIHTTDRSQLKKYFERQGINSGYSSVITSRFSFNYDGEKLISCGNNESFYKFNYNEDQLIKTDIFKNGKIENHINYFYDSIGLKTKAEILDSKNGLKFTITYEYEYYL